jgi:hypothetical protein
VRSAQRCNRHLSPPHLSTQFYPQIVYGGTVSTDKEEGKREKKEKREEMNTQRAVTLLFLSLSLSPSSLY